MKSKLRYQPVLHSDGTFTIHETIIDSNDTILSISHNPVVLQESSYGALKELIKLVYRCLTGVNPITVEELNDILLANSFPNESTVIDITELLKQRKK